MTGAPSGPARPSGRAETGLTSCKAEMGIVFCSGVGMGSLPARMAGSAACRTKLIVAQDRTEAGTLPNYGASGGLYERRGLGGCERGADERTVSTLEVEYSLLASVLRFTSKLRATQACGCYRWCVGRARSSTAAGMRLALCAMRAPSCSRPQGHRKPDRKFDGALGFASLDHRSTTNWARDPVNRRGDGRFASSWGRNLNVRDRCDAHIRVCTAGAG